MKRAGILTSGERSTASTVWAKYSNFSRKSSNDIRCSSFRGKSEVVPEKLFINYARLAGQVMKGGGYGILIDIILGILGGVVGGWIFGLLVIWPGGGMIGSIVVAFVGAVILIWITRLVKKA